MIKNVHVFFAESIRSHESELGIFGSRQLVVAALDTATEMLGDASLPAAYV
jgi:hypothetical protein